MLLAIITFKKNNYNYTYKLLIVEDEYLDETSGIFNNVFYSGIL